MAVNDLRLVIFFFFKYINVRFNLRWKINAILTRFILFLENVPISNKNQS